MSDYLHGTHRQRPVQIGTMWVLCALMLSLISPERVLALSSFKDFAGRVVDVVNSLIEFTMVLALLGFIGGVIRFMYTAGDDKSRETGKHMMLWGTIALFLAVSVWGVVLIIKKTLLG